MLKALKTAVITGASSGLGAQFAKQLRANFPDIECVLLIARREDRLKALALQLEGICAEILTLDLCDRDSIAALVGTLQENCSDVRLLVNNAGLGTLGNIAESDVETQTRMTDLNVSALTSVTAAVLPFMKSGSHIINVSSIASFCANPRMTVYSSTKAYVSSLTRGLSVELKPLGISATAVCPGPMATEFISVGKITGNSKMFEALPYCDPVKVVSGVYKAAKSGKVFYTPMAFYKFYRVLAKLLPHAWVARLAKT